MKSRLTKCVELKVTATRQYDIGGFVHEIKEPSSPLRLRTIAFAAHLLSENLLFPLRHLPPDFLSHLIHEGHDTATRPKSATFDTACQRSIAFCKMQCRGRKTGPWSAAPLGVVLLMRAATR